MKGSIIGIIIAGIVVVGGIVGGIYYSCSSSASVPAKASIVASATNTSISSNKDTVDSKKTADAASKDAQSNTKVATVSTSNSETTKVLQANSDNKNVSSANTNSKADTSSTNIQNTKSSVVAQTATAKGSLAFDLDIKNYQSNVLATPLTSSELSKFVGSWMVGSCVGNIGGGSAYGSDGVKNIPGKVITIAPNYVDYCGSKTNVTNYYMVKQVPFGVMYGNPGIVPINGAASMGMENGYMTTLVATSSSTVPTIKEINDGEVEGISFIIAGNNLIIDDSGSFFTMQKMG